MHISRSNRFRILLGFGIFFLLSCGPKLKEDRAIELIRLNYKQQNNTEGAGTWLLDSVQIDKIEPIQTDSACYRVTARINGLYKLPQIEDAPFGATEKFWDTVQFKACPFGKAWKASEFVIVGARHE